MTTHHPIPLSAPPPVLSFFLGRILVWVGLVGACALPVMMLTWVSFTPAERSAEALGTLLWALVMVVIAERLRWPSPEEARSLRGAVRAVIWNRWTSREADRRSQELRSGALITAAMHTGLAVFAGPIGIFLWFAPAVWAASHLPLWSAGESDFLSALGWTLTCGAQAAIVAWLCGRAVGSARRVLSRRFGTP